MSEAAAYALAAIGYIHHRRQAMSRMGQNCKHLPQHIKLIGDPVQAWWCGRCGSLALCGGTFVPATFKFTKGRRFVWPQRDDDYRETSHD